MATRLCTAIYRAEPPGPRVQAFAQLFAALLRGFLMVSALYQEVEGVVVLLPGAPQGMPLAREC